MTRVGLVSSVSRLVPCLALPCLVFSLAFWGTYGVEYWGMEFAGLTGLANERITTNETQCWTGWDWVGWKISG
jgi:hypothetical protein